MNNKLQAKDLINLGLFTVLYFVLGCCVAIPIGFVPIFLPILGALWTLITGIPFMLFLTRVKKFGMVTLMAILSGLLMGLTDWICSIQSLDGWYIYSNVLHGRRFKSQLRSQFW